MISSLNYLTDLIEEHLQKLPIPHEPEILYDPIHYTLSLGGKRIRPRIVLIACGMCGGDPEEAIPAAMALEMLHNFTLIHDDIMDKAEMRRGKPSVYKKWNESVAILSGDAMFTHALQQLHYYGSDPRFSKEMYLMLEKEFLDAVVTVCRGQALDLDYEADYEITIDHYMEMVEQKTAALISTAFRLGAIIANADQEKKTILGRLGYETGVAFQIQDDLMDITANPDQFGKKRGGDIYEGKMTYLFLTALSKADTDQKAFLKSLRGKTTLTPEDVNKVFALYEELGIIKDTRQKIRFHYHKALEYLKQFGKTDFRDEIESLLERLITRES